MSNAKTSVRLDRPNALTVAHARFARAALGIYVAAAAVSVVLLVVALVTDKTHDEQQITEQMLLQNDVRAHWLNQRLDMLVNELRRLSQRSEVDLGDEDLEPEKSLLELSHKRSTYFNLGVAILNTEGNVVWSEPEAFLSRWQTFGAEKWFGSVQKSRSFRIVPVQSDHPDAVLYVVLPLVKNQEFTGALLGAVDLTRRSPLSANPVSHKVVTVLAARDGAVIYPPVPPRFALESAWGMLFPRTSSKPSAERVVLAGKPCMVASSSVLENDLVLLSVGEEDELFWAANKRLVYRLAVGLTLALTPTLLLLWLLRRSLKLFRKNEEDAVREERLRLLGEAASSIAHEVKNALNSLSVGLDLVVRSFDVVPVRLGVGPTLQPAGGKSVAERRERIVGELRGEIQRLSEFTTELMTFSRGIEPRCAQLDLADFVPKVMGLLSDAAEETGAKIHFIKPSEPVLVWGDGALLRAVISNLAGNALDAATAVFGTMPQVEVRLAVVGAVVNLRVSDNGPGVSPTMRTRLFEPFQSEKVNGVGIGLALARKIARAHGGELSLDEASTPRPEFPGASFVLTLPCLAEASEEST